MDSSIRYGRDCVEPAAKPGDLALVRKTRALTILTRMFDSLRLQFCNCIAQLVYSVVVRIMVALGMKVFIACR